MPRSEDDREEVNAVAHGDALLPSLEERVERWITLGTGWWREPGAEGQEDGSKTDHGQRSKSSQGDVRFSGGTSPRTRRVRARTCVKISDTTSRTVPRTRNETIR